MARYPVEIRRCRHIKTNGTQCGSPAVKGKELCFYHEKNQPRPADIYLEGERYSDWSVVIPVLEDAHSIQTVIQQVLQMMLARRIDRKDAGLMLYGLQIASGNLKAMQAEKVKPTQMVVEPEKAGETPLGMTPWSASGQGHDPEETEEEEIKTENSPAAAPSPEEFYTAASMDERVEKAKDLEERGWIRAGEFEEYLFREGADPLLLARDRLRAAREAKKQKESPDPQRADDQPAAGGMEPYEVWSARMGTE